MPSAAGLTLRVAASTAMASLRAHQTSAWMLVLLASGGIASVVPVLALSASGGTALRFSSVPHFAIDLGWTGAAVHPAAAQQAVVRHLYELLAISALLTFVVVACAILLVAAGSAGERASEDGVRRAVGASRRTLLLAALVEAASLTAIAFGGGGVVAAWLSHDAVRSWPGTVSAGGPSPAFGLVGVMLVLVGAVLLPVHDPARRRLSGLLPQPPGLLMPSMLLGLTLAVLTGAAIVSRSAERVARTDSARGAEGVTVAAVAAGETSQNRAERYERVIAGLKALRGVRTVSLTSPGQSVGLGVVDFLRTDCGVCPRGGIYLPWLEVHATVQIVSSDTFDARGFRVIAGRGIESRDRIGGEPVAVVNRYLAGRYFENGDAVGRDLFVGADWRRARHRVVGIVDDQPPTAFGSAGQPLEALYLSALQHPSTAIEIVVDGEVRLSTDSAAAVVASHLGGPVRTMTAAERIQREAAPGRWFARWFDLQGWIMLGATALGMFAYMRRWVQALSSHIALRRASGATRRRMAVLVVVRAAGVGAAGAGVGLIFLGPPLWTAIARASPGISAWQPATLATFAALLAGVTLAGAGFPACRMLRQPPARFLHTD